MKWLMQSNMMNFTQIPTSELYANALNIHGMQYSEHELWISFNM
jgi:hypothetical protein